MLGLMHTDHDNSTLFCTDYTCFHQFNCPALQNRAAQAQASHLFVFLKTPYLADALLALMPVQCIACTNAWPMRCLH
eukprot:1160473-Pelagomonas_calceolata.AAC.9